MATEAMILSLATCAKIAEDGLVALWLIPLKEDGKQLVVAPESIAALITDPWLINREVDGCLNWINDPSCRLSLETVRQRFAGTIRGLPVAKCTQLFDDTLLR